MEGMQIKNLSFTYREGEAPVFQNMNLAFRKGTLTLLLGPSGCGKSTLLLALNGLIPHVIEGVLEGSIYYQGDDLARKTPKELCTKIGMVHQDPDSGTFCFTVEEEVVFGLENLKYPPSAMAVQLKKVLALVGLSGFEKRQVSSLSGGEKQKLAIAAALALDPEILLLDEPTANLDPVSTQEIFALLFKLKADGKIIILVEHNMEGILEQADDVVVFDHFCRVKRHGLPPSIGGEQKLLYSPEKEHTGQPILRLDKVCYQIAEKEILRGINLTVNHGDFIALLGANGAGKSTLFKIIAKLLPPSDGTLSLFNKELSSYGFRELFKSIGLVFQNPEHQFVSFRVWDELIYGMTKEEKESKDTVERLQRILEEFHLEKKKEANPYQLSQGEKRRLSVAIMLARGQRLLCLDEPTFGQDYENNRALMADMKQLNEQGTTLFVITHDMNLVAEYCNRSIVLHEGRVVFDGTPKALFRQEALLKQARLTVPKYRYSYLEDILRGDV